MLSVHDANPETIFEREIDELSRQVVYQIMGARENCFHQEEYTIGPGRQVCALGAVLQI